MVRSTVYTDTWAVANGLADGQGLRKNRIVSLLMRKSGEGGISIDCEHICAT